MSTVLFWFRNDLRLHDQLALRAACAQGTQHLLPVLCLPDAAQDSGWGFARMGPHRRAWWASTIENLRQNLQALGCPLLVCTEAPTTALPALAQAVGADAIVCEDIAAPEEQADVHALRAAGLQVRTVWQSSLLDPARLPWPVSQLPRVFTPFRQAVEKARLRPDAPLPAPTSLPPWPKGVPDNYLHGQDETLAAFAGARPALDVRSAFPYQQPAQNDGEQSALNHLTQYLARGLPTDYKRTRNGLIGMDYSSKWSPWLATGALSPRQAMAQLNQFEAEHGASDGSYWLWFELLWRDYFRFLHLQHGRALYRARGLGSARDTPHDPARFVTWCAGQTGQPLVDAAMRELAATGYMSNRVRQVAASYLVNDFACDWRVGAAWFEHHLVDYDVYSNQGNWLYIAGRGTDPQGGRRFNPEQQATAYDPDGAYRHLWGTA
ncbi:DASH family cryptochrome [Pigmentiphaga aceris]|uniref:Cryptochrome DASH n=1 Tax=Pigmentiphaga aceris TaxID=1940612 RepID=A0A5C0AVG1_9BURK|nr:DASH family cryptochrome [Pigmentiphaga aceris]QEI06338.1 DASH family cryptochrome [Pigmentiphaga aceris]